MIKFRAEGKDGPLIGLGLSQENMDRMTAGQPVHVKLEELGLEGDIVIFYGKTEDELQRTLQTLIGPVTEIRDGRIADA